MLRIKIFLGLVFVGCFAWAEISGVVFERGRNVKLNQVNVYAPAEKTAGTTDQEGRFVLPVAQTRTELRINAGGFKPYVREVENGQSIIIYLERDNRVRSLNLDVEDTNFKKDQAKKSLDRKQVFDMPGANGDAVKAVQNLPGVNRAGGFSSRVIIQGSAPKDTSYDFEGHEIPLVFHFGGLSSVVMPEAVDHVDYYSAGYQAERSRALGGIISLNTRLPEVTERAQKGLFYVDNLSAGGLFEAKLNERSSFLISGRYSYVGLFLKTALKDNEALNLTVAPEFYDVTGVFNYNLSDGESLKVSLLNSNDKLAFVLNEPVRQDPSVRGAFSNSVHFFRIVPAWSKQIDENDLLKVSVGYGTDQLNANAGANYFNLDSQVTSTRSRWEHRFSPSLQSNVGWDNIYARTKARIRLPRTTSSGGVSNPISSGEIREADVLAQSHDLGLFSEVEYDLTEKLKIIPALRFDRFSLTDEAFVLPRFAVQYKKSDSMIFKMGAGQYAQSPEPQESSADFGNPEIKSPRATHLAIGVEKDFKEGQANGSLVTFNGFFRDFHDLVIHTPDRTTRDGVNVAQIYNNDGRGQAYGLESQWKFQRDELQIIAGYTWSKSYRQNPRDGLYPFEYDQTHNLNLIPMYELGNNWKVSARYRYVTGNPYTPVVSGIYDADNETYFPVRGPLFSDRNEPFQQLDFRIDKKVYYDTAIWTYYLDIQNVLNIKNAEGLEYSYDYALKEKVIGLPLLPSIGIRGEF